MKQLRIWNCWLFGVLVVAVCNFHLITGASPDELMFSGGRVLQGEIHRLVSHVFVHVSWYHLGLNILAVSFLWFELQRLSLVERLCFASASGLGSLIGASQSPLVEHIGFCGLSGVAHGLAVIVGFVWIREASLKRSLCVRVFGVLMIAVSFGKGVFEVVSGEALFGAMHSGNLGVPIVHSHLGGVIGGFAAWLTLWMARPCARMKGSGRLDC